MNAVRIVVAVMILLWSTSAYSEAGVPEVRLAAQTVRLPLEDRADVRFIRLSRSEGLSQQRVTHIVQDDQGFMWFGTQYGLNRYDGYQYRVFKHSPSEPGSLCGVFISALFKDQSGNLWVGCDYSLDRYEPETESFVHYRIDPGLPLDRASAVRHISQDSSGNLWLATGNGLYQLSPDSGEVVRFQADKLDATSLGSNDVKFSGEDRSGDFWVATARGLERFDRNAAQVTLRLSVNEPRELGFYEDKHGVFWLFYGSGNGLAVFDREAGTLTPYAFWPSELSGFPLTGVSSMLEDGDGTLWVATFSDGLLKFDRERNRFIRYRYDPSNERSLTENRITTLARDREGDIWVGFGATEPAFFATRRSLFTELPFDGDNAANLGERLVNELFEDADGTLWAGTTGALTRYEAITGRPRHYEIPGRGVVSDVLAILRDRSDTLWIGTSGQGLYQLDEKTGAVKGYGRIEGDSSSLSNDFVVDLFVDREDRLWVATLGGLNRFDPATGTFSSYQHSSDHQVWYKSIAEDAMGRLWLGSHGAGLVRFDFANHSFQVFGTDDTPDGRLSDLRINTILVDHEGAIWAATQNGLNRLDPDTGKVTAYFEHDGLASSAASCICEDASGAIWIGTSNGLSRLDPTRARFQNYSQADGLPGPDLTGWGACHRGTSGVMYFGGFSGALAFDPAVLPESDFLPSIVLTDFRLFGVPVSLNDGSPLSRSIGYTSQVTLSHEQHSFSFEFSTLSFRSPETNRYRYKLEGLDTDWHEVAGHRRFANYTTVVPGEYHFRVQGATSRGRWNEPGLDLLLTVLPPWWATWWFRLAVLALIALLARTAYIYRVRQIARQFDIRLEARVSERTRIAREVHDSLLQGFQGMMFRLQAVSNLLPARPADAAEALEAVMDRGDEVIAEGRAAVYDLRYMQDSDRDLTASVTALKSELETVANDPQPAYRVTVEGRPRTIDDAIRDEVYRIAREAFRNAAMHSKANNIEAEIGYLDEGLYLRMRDDGIGIDQRILKQGKRIGHWGLQGMRERTEALDGQLTIWSKPGAGTEVELRVPAEVAFKRDASR
ncbi:MAG: two-component regulator propeller domain-containing protein [Woeseia sp.]